MFYLMSNKIRQEKSSKHHEKHGFLIVTPGFCNSNSAIVKFQDKNSDFNLAPPTQESRPITSKTIKSPSKH